jgi:7-carboxy-7-deazaguanine synthase (Cx14CxxC type)
VAYAVKEIFYTLQGEGRQAGRPSVFCRFAGCNLWTGREEDRLKAVCQFCDTDFVGTDGPGGGRFMSADTLADAVAAKWPVADATGRRYVVCTGGEPTLQLDDAIIAALHARNFEVAVESNGTLPVPAAIDWICISPKAGTELAQRTGDELKLVFPQPGAEPELFATLDFRHFLLQPMDGPRRETNTQAALAYCLAHPRWSLSLQTHKFLGIP